MSSSPRSRSVRSRGSSASGIMRRDISGSTNFAIYIRPRKKRPNRRRRLQSPRGSDRLISRSRASAKSVLTISCAPAELREHVIEPLRPLVLGFISLLHRRPELFGQAVSSCFSVNETRGLCAIVDQRLQLLRVKCARSDLGSDPGAQCGRIVHLVPKALMPPERCDSKPWSSNGSSNT